MKNKKEKEKKLISLIVPCYNEEESLPLFYEATDKLMKKMNYVDFELLFINDGSKDKTLEIIRKLAKKDKRVRYISFSRNFGKEAGMLAGLCTGTLHTRFGIPPILSGILTQIALFSVNLRILGGSNKALSVDKYDLILSSRNVTSAIVTAVIFCAALIGAMYWYFGTEQGSAIRATGCNPAMSKAQGINNDNMELIALCLSNGLVAMSGGLLSQFQGFADVNMGRGAIVIGLAAIIIGEVFCDSLLGNKANFAMRLSFVAFGAIVYYVVIGIVIWLRMNPNDLKLFTALIVAVFLAVPNLRAKQKNSFAMAGKRSAAALKAEEKKEV